MGRHLQPFELHPANPGELEAGARNLADAGASALQNGESTRAAYSPAIPSIQGVPHDAVVRATDPVEARARAGSASLVWAGVVVNYWGGEVKEFNRKVQEIVGNMKFIESGISMWADNQADAASAAGEPLDTAAVEAGVQQRRDAMLAQARKEYEAAYDQHVGAGGATASQMLAQGPTARNMQVARDTGAMPGIEQTLGGELQKRIDGRLIPPIGDDGSLLAAWAAGWTLTLGAAGADAYRLRNSHYMPPKPLMTFGDRFRSLTDPTNRIPKTGKGGGMAAANLYLASVTNLGAATAGVAGAAEQRRRDEGRTDLDDNEKTERAGLRAGIVTTTGWLGATAGAVGGGLLGARGGPLGTAVGENLGVFGGGIGGSLVGNATADVVIGLQDGYDKVDAWLNQPD